MNKIDEIRAKLEGLCWENDFVFDSVCTLPRSSIEPILEIISPYLSHGITEEEAGSLALLLWPVKKSIIPQEEWKKCVVNISSFLGLITSSREPIAEPEHTIHTLAEDQKDLAPAVNKMVNEKFWELLEDKPNALNDWNNEVKDYALDAREYNTDSMDKLNFTGNEIKSIILKGNAMRDELKAYIDKLRHPI